MTMKRVHVLLSGFALVLAACGEEERAPRSDDGRPVKLFTVGEASSGWEREYLGTIAAAQQVEIGFEVSGQIVEFTATAGQRVAAGDVLAKLDTRNFVATKEAADAQLTAAKADVDRKRGLVEVGGVSRVALEEAERRMTAAQSDVATAGKALEDAELRAPFNGVVARTIEENFANVRAKQPVLTFQDPSWMEIEVNIPEADAALAIPGLTIGERNLRLDAAVIVSAIPDREFEAHVSEFSTTADPVTRTYAATCVFETPGDVSVLAGMTAHVRIRRKQDDAEMTGYRVPVHVVAGDDEKNPYVWVIGGDMKASQRPVEIGEISGSMIHVLSGVEPGDRVALTGVHHLREGLLVSEWEAE